MTTANWCVFAAIWLPYLFIAMAKAGAPGMNNHSPRLALEQQQGWRKRAYWAHLNAFEAFPPFAAAVVIAQMAQTKQAYVNYSAMTFVLFRLLHGICYITNLSLLRSLSWLGGIICIVMLFVSGNAMSDPNNTQMMIEAIKKDDSYVRAANKNAKISNPVLEAMAQLDRQDFIPTDMSDYAYDNSPLEIGFGQTISQPYMVALMTSLLDVNENSTVLEIGTGSGYQAAVLSKIVKHVYSMEIIEELSNNAQMTFQKLGISNVSCKCHNGYSGWEGKQMFDGIIVTAAATKEPTALYAQLKENASIIIPLEDKVGNQVLYKITKAGSSFKKVPIIPVRFVPMVSS